MAAHARDRGFEVIGFSRRGGGEAEERAFGNEMVGDQRGNGFSTRVLSRVERMEEQKRNYHFVGICGTAMGALAVALKDCGNRVTGSDARVYPPMSTFLADEGIEVIEGFRADNLPADADVIVIGNAMSRGNEEVEEVLNRKLLYMSLPEVLKNTVLRGKRNIVVTGTHGKTTTSSMAA